MQQKRVRDKKAKIRLIFENFAELVNKNGYDRLSTRHIAKAAGISIGTIYHYFPGGKHDIASRYIDHVTDELYDPNIFKKLGENGLQQFFDELIQKYLTVHEKYIEIHRAIDQAILADPDVYKRNREAITENISGVVMELRGMGYYDTLPETIVLNSFILILNILEGLIHRHLFIYPLFNTKEKLMIFLVKLMAWMTKEGLVFTSAEDNSLG